MSQIKKIKNIFAHASFLVIVFSSFNSVNAQKLFGFNDPPGCGGDTFLPNLVICGRNPQVASAGEGGQTCLQYTKQCNLGDMVETGQRALVWIISIALLIVPLIVMYYGAMIIYEQQWHGNIDLIKKYKDRIFEIILYFILMLSAWLIVKLVIDVFQVNDDAGRVPIFLIDDAGNSVKVKTFNTNQ